MTYGPSRGHPLGMIGFLSVPGASGKSFGNEVKRQTMGTVAMIIDPDIRWAGLPVEVISRGRELLVSPSCLFTPEERCFIASLDLAMQWDHATPEMKQKGIKILTIPENQRSMDENRFLSALRGE